MRHRYGERQLVLPMTMGGGDRKERTSMKRQADGKIAQKGQGEWRRETINEEMRNGSGGETSGKHALKCQQKKGKIGIGGRER